MQHCRQQTVTGGRPAFYLRVLWLTLLGYMIAGKGFAYLGFGQMYVGEVVLGTGLLVLALTPSAITALTRVRKDTVTIPLIVLFCIWGACLTAPYLDEYGMDAPRDAVLWGYSAFALIVYALMSVRPALLPKAVEYYGALVRRLPYILLPIIILVTLGVQGPEVAPDVRVISFKGGDLGVHLSGAALAYVVELYRFDAVLWPFLTLVCVFMLACGNRASALAFFSGVLVSAFVRRGRAFRRVLRLAIPAAVVAVLALTALPEIQLYQGRTLSPEQFVTNLRSVFVTIDNDDRSTEATKNWRLAWWSTIIDYTIHGEYFWTGKGFGRNLAIEDGFATPGVDRRRSPHNSHLAVLARAGVPGFMLWAGIQLSWGWAILQAYRRTRRIGLHRWASLFIFLLGYWVAFDVNACFDVFLEGPMGGIWYWTVVGVGLAAVRLSRTHPGLLECGALPATAGPTVAPYREYLYPNSVIRPYSRRPAQTVLRRNAEAFGQKGNS